MIAETFDPTLATSALHNLGDGLTLVDVEQRVVFWNAYAETMLRVSTEAVLGQPIDAIIQHIAAQTTAPNTTRAQLASALAEANPEHWVEMQFASSEETRIVAARCFRLQGENGTNVGVGILWRDVTRERTADAMKSQLLSTVSHELRTPLASIKGFATTLLRQDVKWDETAQRDFLRIIEEEADRLTEIIDNLLDMSQIEAGALRVSKEPTALRPLIRSVVDEMRMRTEAHYFVVDLPVELPRVLIDPRRIRQVLTNLIGNAIKYSPRGQITVSCEVQGDHVIVSVSDQGEGIPPQYLDKIFERFFQVDGTTKRRVGGIGLGLSIARSIIEAHDGKIWAESTPGQGSTFHFTLPCVREESNGQEVANE
jgi:signal transduction histidine kinase